MSMTALQAAKTIGEISHWSLSNLQMHKILFIAHMFYLGNNGERLISDDFEAWDYGPVLPALYQKAKIYGSGAVGNVFHSVDSVQEGAAYDALKDAVEKLSKFNPATLIAYTHKPGGAWDKNYESGCRGNVIPEDDILAEFNAI